MYATASDGKIRLLLARAGRCITLMFNGKVYVGGATRMIRGMQICRVGKSLRFPDRK